MADTVKVRGGSKSESTQEPCWKYGAPTPVGLYSLLSVHGFRTEMPPHQCGSDGMEGGGCTSRGVRPWGEDRRTGREVEKGGRKGDGIGKNGS